MLTPADMDPTTEYLPKDWSHCAQCGALRPNKKLAARVCSDACVLLRTPAQELDALLAAVNAQP
jgi:hypothetical protein